MNEPDLAQECLNERARAVAAEARVAKLELYLDGAARWMGAISRLAGRKEETIRAALGPTASASEPTEDLSKETPVDAPFVKDPRSSDAREHDGCPHDCAVCTDNIRQVFGQRMNEACPGPVGHDENCPKCGVHQLHHPRTTEAPKPDAVEIVRRIRSIMDRAAMWDQRRLGNAIMAILDSTDVGAIGVERPDYPRSGASRTGLGVETRADRYALSSKACDQLIAFARAGSMPEGELEAAVSEIYDALAAAEACSATAPNNGEVSLSEARRTAWEAGRAAGVAEVRAVVLAQRRAVSAELKAGHNTSAADELDALIKATETGSNG